MTCAVCAWTMLADSDMSPLYTLPLVLCALVCEIRQQLAAKEGECRQKDERNREKDEVIREKSAAIQAQQAKIQQLRDQLAVFKQVS